MEIVSGVLVEYVHTGPEGCKGCKNWIKLDNGFLGINPYKCRVYKYPEAQHNRIMGCAMRTHNKVKQVENTFKLNPIKASRRGASSSRTLPSQRGSK